MKENYKTKIEKHLQEYLKQRQEKVKKYQNRLMRHKNTVMNQKWQIRILLKDQKESNKLLNLSFEKTKEPYAYSFLILDSGHSSLPNIFCYDLKSFLDLKKTAKRTYTKLLHDCLILAPVQKSALIMKSLAKVVSRYNKSIIFVPESTMTKEPKDLIKDYENKCFLKVDKNNIINFKLGHLRESTEDILKRISNIQQILVNNGLEILDLYIKPSFGKPLKLND